MGSCAAPSAKGDDKFITTDYLQQCRFEQQRYRASGLNLVTAAIVLLNTVYLERATSALRAHCKALDDTLLQYLSPLGWEHINLTGDYLWRSSAKVGAGKFRPLRPLPPA
ncbi:Tn3 family transposase [Pseudomonas aeruginosa]